jgi:diguanylate cyclase (GGDEF)-like protein/PAS domain S-box-containing protein
MVDQPTVVPTVVVDLGDPVPTVTQPGLERLGRLIAFCPEAYVEVDAAGVVTEWNPQAERVLGWRRDEVVGRGMHETVLPAELGVSPFADVGRDGGIGGRGGMHREFELVHKAGHRIVAEARLFATGSGPDWNVGGFLVDRGAPAERDVSRVAEQVLQTAQGRRPELHDPLTGLPNRTRFAARLATAVAVGRGIPGAVAVVLLDIDRFKAINDTMGHDTGDLLLALVSQRLVRVAGDAELVARFGGDEFLALFVDRAGTAATRASSFVERARRSLAAPFQVNGTEIFLAASVGVALNTFGVDDSTTLLSNAEAAMYRAKHGGRSSVVTFGESMRFEVLDRMTTEHALHRAIERHELTLHYQPVVEIDGATTVGLEALLRWSQPGTGLVAPGRFIPVAEESGMIIPIGAWVLEEACRQLRDWQDRERSTHLGSMEVNLSARQIDDPRIVRTVEQILLRTGLPPELLTLEITESALMHDAAGALVVLRALKDIGVSLAIDDFGTGYSSLSYLSRFPLDIVKVDRLFVDELGVSREDEEIVSAVIKLAHALGLKVVAEGVETAGQLEILRRLGCDLAQGFLFSEPLPAAAIAAALGHARSA